MNENPISLQNPINQSSVILRRRDLLPWWIKAFTWMFLLFGVFTPVAYIYGSLQPQFQLSMLGLQTSNPLSVMGIIITLIFIFKGVVAYGLWFEKDWAVKLAKIDAILSLIISVGATFYPLVTGTGMNFRLEVVVLIPYYLKLQQIQHDWENFGSADALVIE